jgi:hypothetical protein
MVPVTSENRAPITPTKVIPAAKTLPAPVPPPPPPPPPPPAPPAVPDREPEWWRGGHIRTEPPPLPVPVDVHVAVTIDTAGPLAPLEPEPGPRWWQRIRIAYNLGCAFAGFVVCGPWAWLLTALREGQGLAAAWVAALIPLVVIAFIDNARRVEALHADPDLWWPRLKAVIARVLLWAALEATALALPLTSLVYWITGVQTP